MSARVLFVLAALALAGCAAKAPLVETRLAGPLTGKAFRISSAGADASPAVERMVAEGLQGRGLRAAAAGETADYAVSVTYADRGASVGAFVPAASGEPTWLAKGQKRRPWSPRGVATLNLRIVDNASGREAYDARVSRPYRKAPSGADLPVLVAAALPPR